MPSALVDSMYPRSRVTVTKYEISLCRRSGSGSSGSINTLNGCVWVASGSPGMWREIILTNRSGVLVALDDADEQLMQLRDLIELGDGPGIEKFFAAAAHRRDALVAKRLRRDE